MALETCRVDIAPKPKGRPRGTIKRKGKKSYVLMFTPKSTIDYQKEFCRLFSEHYDGNPKRGEMAIFYHFARKHKTKTDLDNLEKAASDALNKFLYIDDKQIRVSYTSLEYIDEEPYILIGWMLKSEFKKDRMKYLQQWHDLIDSHE